MSKVWFAPVETGESERDIEAKVMSLYEKSVPDDNLVVEGDFVAIKIHFGEGNNTGYVKPEYLKKLVNRFKTDGGKPFFTDANTLYKGERSNSIDHLMQAYKHGFTPDNIGVPVIIADGLLSKNYSKITIKGRHFNEVNIANDILHSDVFICISHLTGHMAAGMGATIKNIGMGCASRSGKQLQHADVSPSVSANKCRICGKCANWCPVDAIEMGGNNAIIDTEICYGCAECITTCQYGAISVSWSGTSRSLQEKMAEYALGAIKDKFDRSLFFNFLIHVTKDCDCIGRAQQKVINDIGILASRDSVAVDQAAVDLLNKSSDSDFFRDLRSSSGLDYNHQLEHAEKIGLGRREYELIKI